MPDSFTFVSQAQVHGATSCLDHCISTVAEQFIISDVSRLNTIVCSDHLSLCIDVRCDSNPICTNSYEMESTTVPKWNLAYELDKQKYATHTSTLLSGIELPSEALSYT